MPFIETAMVGDGSTDNILHYGGIRLRVNGTGNLRLTLYGYDKVSSEVLTPVVMTAAPGREKVRLANFKSELALVRLETTAIDETFKINKMMVYVKQLYTSYPA